MVRALASHQCGLCSYPGFDAICGLSVLLVLSLAPRGFSPGTPVFPSPYKPILPNSISIWNAQTHFNEFSRTPKRSIGKQITITFFFYDLLSPSWCNLIQMLRVQSEVKNKFFDYSLFHFPFSNLQVRRICTYSLSFLP